MTKKLNDALQLQEKLRRLVHDEREVLNEILDLIILAETHRSYLELGHSSLFDWLTTQFKYSESAAKRRIDAARLKRSVPTLEEKIESGLVNLSTVSKVQSAIRAEEIRSKSKMTDAEKEKVIEKIEGKTGIETEKILMAEFPEAQIFVREKIRLVSASEVHVSIVMTEQDYETFRRATELLSHSVPGGSPGKVVAALSREFVRRRDPLVKKQSSKDGVTDDSQRTNADVQVDNSKIEKLANISCRENSPGRVGVPESESESESQLEWELESASQLQSKSELGPAFEPQLESPIRISRHIPNAIWRQVFRRDESSCQFRDQLSGKICGSRYQVQIDHIKPWALGGEHTLENLRCLCAQHNRHRAVQTFGDHKVRASLSSGRS